MSRNIYLTEKEIEALISTSSEWCDMMSSGDDISFVDDKLNDGLGFALKKLYKGKNGEQIYKNYES